MKGCLLVLAAGLVLVAGAPAGAQGQDGTRVLVTEIDDAITPVIADHLVDGVERAEDGGYAAYVVSLDTPGGLDSSMRKIIQRFLGAEVPVVVFVSPQGARAASAGALITFSAHVAAMAPATSIGAATPVNLDGGEVGGKVVNDAAAFAESVAEVRGRNVEFAGQTVREGRSVSASEAVELGAVDMVASSVTELLDAVDGSTVEVGPAGRPVTLAVAGAVQDQHELGLFRQIQQVLADPNVAFLLLSLGTLAIVYELASPGIGAGGTVGVISILIGLFSLSVLPVNAVGLLLLLAAAVLFVAELYAPGIGVAAVGGTAALVLSGVFLFDDAPGLEVSLAVVTPIALVVGGLVVVAGRLVVRAKLAESTTTGPGLFVGRTVTVEHVRDGHGQAHIEGAWWRVRSSGGPLVEGSRARIVEVAGLDLVVVPEGPEASQPQETGAS